MLEELDLFPENAQLTTTVLISNFEKDAEQFALPLLQLLRHKGISAELYPSPAKLKKQLSYADDKRIPYVVLIGSEEIASGKVTLRNMQSGTQQQLSRLELVDYLLKESSLATL